MKYKLLLCGINLLLCLSTCFSSALMAAETVIDFTGKNKRRAEYYCCDKKKYRRSA